MFHLRRAAVFLSALALLHTAQSAVLLHEYALRGTLEDNLGGDALKAHGGDITALGYIFAANEGVTFSSRSFNPTSYTVEFSFKLASPSGVKLVDFHNLTAEPGLYHKGTTLAFSPYGGASVPDLIPGTDAHIVLTRDGATNLVTAYVDGTQRFSFIDDQFTAVPPGFSNKLTFFINDDNSPGASGGTLNYLRVFDGALTAAEVSTVFGAGPPAVIPEPSTFVLLTLGSLMAYSSHRRWLRKARGTPDHETPPASL